MAAAGIKLEGDKEVAARMNAIAKKVAGAICETAAFESAEPLVDDMRAHTPVFLDRLRPGIDRQLKERKGPAVEVWVGPTRRRFVARFLEFGTRKMSAKPFIRPSIARMTTAVLRAFRASAFRQMDEVGGALK